MCELFGISSSSPVHLFYSLDEFSKHGGKKHINRSGWGIASYSENDVLLIRDVEAAAKSPWVRFIEEHGIRSHVTISHVRYATIGKPSIRNTHPFRRELGGQMHVFAHNGSIGEIFEKYPFRQWEFRPVGQTDSEHAFCLLMQRLKSVWRQANGDIPDLKARLEVVAKTAADLRKLGSANFLYSDGDVLFAHGHRRSFDDSGVFGPPRPPGLCIGKSRDVVRGLKMKWPESNSTGLMVASVPLTSNGWAALPEGCVVALRNGREIARVM